LAVISTWAHIDQAQSAPLTCDKKQTFVVISIENKTSESEWKNHLIALGLRNLIHEELLATGCYLPAETDLEVQSLIDEWVIKSWGGQPAASDAGLRGARGAVFDTTVKAVIKSFSREHSRLRVGPFSSGSATIKVVIELSLQKSDGVAKRAEGMGKGVTKAQGLIFQIRENKVYFDESAVGIAVHEAIKAAVKRLMER
jgi:hypothetical protein